VKETRMINKDGFCSNCKCYHYPNRLYEDDCGRRFVPLKRTPQPTTEEIYAQKQQALREKIAAEHLVRQREQAKLERRKTIKIAMLQEDMRRVHQQQAEARDAKSAEIHAQMAETRAWMKAQAQARQVDQLALKHDLRTVRADREVQEAAERLLRNQRARERHGGDQ
jgi:hypothetical protein